MMSSGGILFPFGEHSVPQTPGAPYAVSVRLDRFNQPPHRASVYSFVMIMFIYYFFDIVSFPVLNV